MPCHVLFFSIFIFREKNIYIYKEKAPLYISLAFYIDTLNL